MGRIIAIASGKGGVGKTTLVANLTSALTQLGKTAVAIDANLTTPNLGLQLGVPLYPVTLQDVLSGEARVKEALYKHRLGFHVIPADISLRRLTKTTANEMINVFYRLADSFDFVIADSAAGLGREALATVQAADELITITNPEMPALVEALKLGRIAEKTETNNLGVVVNRVCYGRHEVSRNEIKNFLNMGILAEIPEDNEVKNSVYYKEPLVFYKPNSPAARKFSQLAANLAGVKPKKQPFLKVFRWLR